MHVISIAAAAVALDVSERTIRRLIAAGLLPAYRVGHSVRIRTDDLSTVLRPVVGAQRVRGDAA